MFRPCIDLHEGKVKQIVGGTLGDSGLKTNFISEKPASYYAELYRRDNLRGGHIIMLGPDNKLEAAAAVGKFPGGMQVGGGIELKNASGWIDAGASHVIVTSWVFREGRLDQTRLDELIASIGKARLVLDLSCRKRGDDYIVMTDRWQKYTEMKVDAATLQTLGKFCAEFLVHAVDVEGLCRGIDGNLGQAPRRGVPYSRSPTPAARKRWPISRKPRGSARAALISTIGSALDIFGGTGREIRRRRRVQSPQRA